MNQKVWVIPEQDWAEPRAKNRIIDGRQRDAAPEKGRAEKRPLPRSAQKSPALSFSFSMLLWGSGQMYSREYGPGVKFMASMVFFYAAISCLVFFPASVSRFIAAIDIPVSVFIIALVAVFVVGLVLWLGSAVDAYYRTTRSRSEPFRGVDNGLWPLLCSLLFPGWGQFLNGQPRKGLFFLPFGVVGIASALLLPASRYVWPLLRTGHDRLVFEGFLAAALAAIPAAFLLWLVAIYDAFGSCREQARRKREPPHAGRRVRRPSIAESLVPRGTAILGLLLAISLGMQFIPRRYYLDSLESLRQGMLRNHMEIVPEMLGKAIAVVDR